MNEDAFRDPRSSSCNPIPSSLRARIFLDISPLILVTPHSLPSTGFSFPPPSLLPTIRPLSRVAYTVLDPISTVRSFMCLSAFPCASISCSNSRMHAFEVGAKVELHSLNATEHNGKHGELLEYDAEAQRWAVER